MTEDNIEIDVAEYAKLLEDYVQMPCDHLITHLNRFKGAVQKCNLHVVKFKMLTNRLSDILPMDMVDPFIDWIAKFDDIIVNDMNDSIKEIYQDSINMGVGQAEMVADLVERVDKAERKAKRRKRGYKRNMPKVPRV